MTVKTWLYSHNYDNGLKLMEHSYLGNNFVLAFELLINCYPQIVVWAGDYTKPCKRRKTNVYKRCLDKLEALPIILDTSRSKSYIGLRYIVNHTTKQYVDKLAIKPDKDGYTIHPLPLLTCEGNGLGGGDYFGEADKHLVGTWARNLISIEDRIPKGYKELVVNFEE